MKCYKQLIQCKFLTKTSKELSSAQTSLLTNTPSFPPGIYTNKAYRKLIYNTYIEDYSFLKEVCQLSIEQDILNAIFYTQEDPFLFIFSRSKSAIKQAQLYSFNVHGNMPIHKSRHTINNRTWFTLLIDTRLVLPEFSPN